MKNKYIAVTIQNYVQFYSIKNALDILIKDGVNVDFYVPFAKDDWGLKEMFDEIYDFLKKSGYNVRRNPIKRKYKILLEPYTMEYYFSFNYEYRIKYNYGLNSPKPSLTYRDVDNFCYDAILSYSTYEAEELRTYTKTYVVGKPNYYNFKKKINKSSKKTLLYLPTYGESNSINDIADELFKLKDKYTIITKLHHGTNYFNYESQKRDKLNDLFSECYDSKYPLENLLSRADVVLSDNSGSIFDAIYANVPVAIFSRSIEYFKYEDLEPYQYTLIQDGIIPYTNSPDKLSDIIEEALSKNIKNKQNELHEKLFNLSYNDGLKEFITILNLYLNDEVNMDAIKLHRIFYRKYSSLTKECEDNKQEILKLNDEMNKITNEKDMAIAELNKLISEYRNGKLYKISSKIYSIVSKIRKRDNNEN